jgi:ribosomal protein S18 acetylase RimI-like enzyme
MDALQIRPARVSDAPVIRDFNLALAQETESLALDAHTVLRGVTALLEDPTKGRYFVAERGGKIVGQVMHTFEWSDWRHGMFWWLQSVYVAPAARRSGVFTALYRHIESLARADESVCGIRLYMEHDNQRAREAYHRLGFASAGYEVLGLSMR